jgi:hypothetical protein
LFEYSIASNDPFSHCAETHLSILCGRHHFQAHTELPHAPMLPGTKYMCINSMCRYIYCGAAELRMRQLQRKLRHLSSALVPEYLVMGYWYTLILGWANTLWHNVIIV